MDFETKYYRPNLAKGTAGAAKTTPTPIRRSTTKWAMPIESGGSGGDSPIMDIKAAGTNAAVINAALAEYMPLEVPQSVGPQSININLQGNEFSGSYDFTVTPGEDYFCAATSEPGGKGEPITFEVVASNNIIEFTIMAATQIDGSDMVGWKFNIAGGPK